MAANWPSIKAGIFAGESKGDYNALFGFSNRPGGQFANTRLTDMTVDQAINFANPSGPYAQWVKGQIGHVATPMGGFQVVGNTLQQAKQWAGLSGNERMTPETQDRIGQAILAKQGTGAWAGYKGPATPADPNYGPTSDAMSRPSGSSWSPAPDPGTTAGILGGPAGGILGDVPQHVADYATSPDDEKSPLQKLFAGLAQYPDAPTPRLGPMGDARSSGDALLKFVQSLKRG